MIDNTINCEKTMGREQGALLANRYRVVRQLGQGGMGSVWLAEDTQLENREVAIKMLPSILVSNKRAYNQLKSEALVSLKLTHPNIATVRAFEENGGNPFLVVDYIDGQTLDDYLADKGKLSEDETIRLLGPIAAALDYAHGEGVVHRDVKPGNIMIRKDGHPFILDFGIAREMQETITRVTGKLSSGTLMYISPEQLDGDAPKASQDVYSFAAMAYECLKGETPFCRGAIEDQIRNTIPPSLSSDITIGNSVMAALAKKPGDRPDSCAAILTVRVSLAGSQKEPFDASIGEKKEEAVASANTPRLLSRWVAFVQSMSQKKRMGLVVSAGFLTMIAVAFLMRSSVSIQSVACLSLEDQALMAFRKAEFAEGYALAMQTDCQNPDIQLYLGKCYACGLGVEQDKAQAVTLFRKAATFYHSAGERGDAKGQCGLGTCYRFGWGVEKDEREEMVWYRKAAEQGYAAAQCGLGECYAVGRGVEKNEKAAVGWFRKAAEQGYAPAQCGLGECYYSGMGVEKDWREAAIWYRKAAEQGEATAQYNLSVCYANGRGVGKDRNAAEIWLLKAAENGNAIAQYEYGEHYGDKSKWFLKAALQGHAGAMAKLGDYYYFEGGTNKVEAVKWYRKAAECGNDEAKKCLETLTR